MKKLALAVSAFLILSSNAYESTPPEFDVHEWGVFMFYQGIGADLLSGIDEGDLPSFVLSANTPHDANCTCDNCKEAKLKCPNCGGVRGRCMCFPHVPDGANKKPVINFYTNRDLNVKLSVKFNNGKHTFWYPKHTTISKQQDRLEWEIKITQKPTNKLKEPKGSSWWELARDTDSAYVNTKNGDTEKFLFYEGESTKLNPSIELKLKDSKVEIVNKSKYSYSKILAAKNGKIVKLNEIPKSEIDFSNTIDVKNATSEIEKMLTTEGLNEKEARGIAKIWEEEFFTRDGTRVIYMMTRDEVDKILPLEITPKPKNLKRAMLVCVQESHSLVNEMIKKLGSADPSERDHATKTLIRIGKPIKSMLKDALSKTKDPEVKNRIETILSEIEKNTSELKNDKCKCPTAYCNGCNKMKTQCKICGISFVSHTVCSDCARKMNICNHCGKKVD